MLLVSTIAIAFATQRSQLIHCQVGAYTVSVSGPRAKKKTVTLAYHGKTISHKTLKTSIEYLGELSEFSATKGSNARNYWLTFQTGGSYVVLIVMHLKLGPHPSIHEVGSFYGGYKVTPSGIVYCEVPERYYGGESKANSKDYLLIKYKIVGYSKARKLSVKRIQYFFVPSKCVLK